MPDANGDTAKQQKKESAAVISPDIRDQFMLAEYNQLWEDFKLSASAIEAWARYFVLLVGGYVAVATALAGPIRGEGVQLSTSAAQALGIGLIPLAAVGLATCLYFGRERGNRVEDLRHLGAIRSYFETYCPSLSPFLLRRKEPPFCVWPWSGDFARVSVVALVSTFIGAVAAYLIQQSADISKAFSSSSASHTDLPTPSGWAWLALCVAAATHYGIFYLGIWTWGRGARGKKNGGSA